MPYVPYWFEFLEPWFAWVVPTVAIVGLWMSRSSLDKRVERIAERTYFSAMFLVAAATFRTVVADDGCWLLHMGSMGIMVLGAALPKSNPTTEIDGDFIWSDT
jgi:hypothetical protein